MTPVFRRERRSQRVLAGLIGRVALRGCAAPVLPLDGTVEGGPMSADMAVKLATGRRRTALIALALAVAVSAIVALPSAHARPTCAGISDPAGDVYQETAYGG